MEVFTVNKLEVIVKYLSWYTHLCPLTDNFVLRNEEFASISSRSGYLSVEEMENKVLISLVHQMINQMCLQSTKDPTGSQYLQLLQTQQSSPMCNATTSL